MKILISCEYSGTVRDTFIALGHDAVSCDLLPTDKPGPHLQCDIQSMPLDFFKQFDLLIAHPPCTDLAVSGARWFKEKLKKDPKCQNRALDFVRWHMNLPIEYICIENPISIISSHIRKPDQVIQPWMFGHGETKATCLWLKNLPLLFPTNLVSGRENKIHKMPPSKDRWKERSKTFQGIADAMAKQWSKYILERI